MDDGHSDLVGEFPEIFRAAANADLDHALGIEHAVEHRLTERAAVMELASPHRGRRCRNARRYAACRPAACAPTAFRIGRLIEWSPPTLSGTTPAATTLAMKASMSSWQLSSEKRERIGTSPTSANLRLAERRDPQHVLVGADALDRAHRARPEARAGAVGDAEVHRHADQREIEAAEIGQIGASGR